MNLRSAPATLLLGGLSLALVTLLGWFLLIGPTVGELGATGDRKTEAEDRAGVMSIQLSKLRNQAEELPATRREAEALAQVFPPTADQPGFFAQVDQAASDAGIRAKDVIDVNHEAPAVPSPDAEGGAAQSLTVPEALTNSEVALQMVTVTVKGRYDRLARVLANLESMRRTLLVTSVQVSGGDESTGRTGGRPVLDLTVTGVTFVAPPLEAPEVDGAAGQRDGDGGDDTEQAAG